MVCYLQGHRRPGLRPPVDLGVQGKAVSYSGAKVGEFMHHFQFVVDDGDGRRVFDALAHHLSLFSG